MIDLNKKAVLLIAPEFFGYQIEISNNLKESGADVVFFDERPKNDFFTKAFIRINKNIIKKKITKYYDDILEKISNTIFDYIIIINIEAMTSEILKKLRVQQPSAKYILYMWDSILNKKNTAELIGFFDSVYSFEKQDCAKIKTIKFRPLFYGDSYKHIADTTISKTKYDFCFIGTVHSDRYNILQKIIELKNEIEIKFFFYMFFQKRILFWMKKITDPKFKKAKIKDFHFRPLLPSQTMYYINNSKIIIDIHHPNQSGLTIRTIEALGAKKKLITTNADIKNYDFYNEDNILIIDRINPKIPINFYNSTYKEIPIKIYNKYSISSWIQDILS